MKGMVKRVACYGLPVLLGWQPLYAYAGAKTDGSVGAVQTLSGNFKIPETLGTIKGGNLFHSFDYFNIASGESATFTTNSALSNVISRVTGGTASTINGALALQASQGTPAFFFINPAGVTFGAGASVDVPGAFHVSTANYLKFADGAILHTDLSKASTLTAAAPQAFGFLGDTRGAVVFKDGSGVLAKSFQTISVSAGDISLDSAILNASGGDIRLSAVGNTLLEIPLDGSLPSAYGSLDIRNGVSVFTSANGDRDAGKISISTGTLTVDGGTSTKSTGIFNQSPFSATGNGGDIELNATGKMSFLSGGEISSSTLSTGSAGKVFITADSLKIEGANSGIFSRATGASFNQGHTGDAGSINISTVGDIEIRNGGAISSSSSSSGNAKGVLVAAGSSFSQETNGIAVMRNPNTLAGMGNITIDGQTVVTGIFSKVTSNSFNKFGSGNAGIVATVAAGNIDILNGGVLSASTFAPGSGGYVLAASGVERLTLDGTNIRTTPNTLSGPGNIRIDAQGLTGIGTGLYSAAGNTNIAATGDAGRVVAVATGRIDLADGGQINSSTFSSGSAGSVSVQAVSIRIDGTNSGILSQASNTAANHGQTGDAGMISVLADADIEIVHGGRISSSTYSSGNGGTVHVGAGIGFADDGQSLKLTLNSNVSTGHGNIRIDGQGVSTGIFNDAGNDSASVTGSAGRVYAAAAGNIGIFNGGRISSSTASSGDAGAVIVGAGMAITVDDQGTTLIGTSGPNSDTGNITIDGSGISTGIFSRANTTQANKGSTGSAGNLTIGAAGNIEIDNKGFIDSSTFTSGNAGQLRVGVATNFGIDQYGFYTLPNANSPTGTGNLKIDGKGALTGIFNQANAGSAGNAGDIVVFAAGNIELDKGGAISSSTFSPGYAGFVYVYGGSLKIDAQGLTTASTGILSQAVGTQQNNGQSGDAGSVQVFTLGDMVINAGGSISSSTSSAGNAGLVLVGAGMDITVDQGWITEGRNSGSAMGSGNIRIDGQGVSTGIFSRASNNQFNQGNTGGAGDVIVAAAGNIDIYKKGSIDTSTSSSGDAGFVVASAGSSVVSDSDGFRATRNPGSTAAIGNITIDGQGVSTGIFNQASSGTGNAGSIFVAASGNIEIDKGSSISSSTFSPGAAGAVWVGAGNSVTIDNSGALQVARNGTSYTDTGNIKIDAQAFADFGTGIFSNAGNKTISATGNAGVVNVGVAGKLEIDNGGTVSSSTFSSGAAGLVSVDVGNLAVSGHGSGVFSQANSTQANKGKTGDAGSVDVSATGGISLVNAGQISTSTSTSGKAGQISVAATTLILDTASFISSDANAGSSGKTGNVTVVASDSLRLANAKLTIENNAKVSDADAQTIVPTTLTVTAPIIVLENGGKISAASSANVAASNIEVYYTGRMTVDPSSVTTSAVDGNGGKINISGTGPLILDHSQITTSVSGTTNGNGGDITISAPVLVMNTGFIQANTAAKANGGNVIIDVQSLLTSGNVLLRGGALAPYDASRANYNVIQAAAPDGVNGAINLSSPQIDLSGSLNGLTAQILDLGSLGMDLCRIGAGSSLTPLGKGGITPPSTALLSAW